MENINEIINPWHTKLYTSFTTKEKQKTIIIYVMHQQDCLLSCQLCPTFPPVVEGMRLMEL